MMKLIPILAVGLVASNILVLYEENGKFDKLRDALPKSATWKPIGSEGLPALFSHGRRSWDSVLLLAFDLPSKYRADTLARFVSTGGNFLWAIDAKASVELPLGTRDALKQFGRIVEAKPEPVLDYFSNLDGDAGLVAARRANEWVLPGTQVVPWRGWSHRLDRANPLVFPILTAPPTAAKINGKLSGTENVLISGLTGRAGGRMVLSTSLGPFEDALWEASMMDDLLSWSLGQRAKLHLETIRYELLESSIDFPRIRDPFEVEVCLKITDREGKLVPYQPSGQVQIELTMMSPWIRATLEPDVNGGLRSGPLQFPDRYGAYSLVLRYQRHGLDHVVVKEPLTVLPYKYDQTDRFARVLWPYYFAWALQLVISFLVLLPSLLHLLKANSETKEKEKSS